MIIEESVANPDQISESTDSQNRKEWTPMHYAAEAGSTNVIILLTNRGAGVDPTDA